MDWTIYYIGQTQYLNLNEAFLSYVIAGNTLIQFFTLRFWSRMNERKGVVFTLSFGIFGFCCHPISMIVSTALPASVNQYVFLLMNTLSCFAVATLNLNLFQCLLQVLDEENRTLSISIYTIFVSLSNAVMPIAGVALYRGLGADLSALRTAFIIVFFLRIIAGGLWLLRWYLTEGRFATKKKGRSYA